VAREPEPLLGTNHFRVLIGRRELGFCEVGRLSSVTDLEAPPDAQRHRFETLVLRRALTRSSELFDWRRKVLAGSEDRRPVTIQQLDASAGTVVNTWRLERAWPCRWSGPAFDARQSDIAYEELELAYDDIVWQAEGSGPRSTAHPRTQGD
jgi:T4-like virus tail tube protein gp19